MLIIADKKIPDEAKSNLRKFGELVLLETSGITEESISGHPDIFFCKTPEILIVAPNIPDNYKNVLSEKNISFVEGRFPVGMKYPGAARYNAVITNDFIIHRTDITDPSVSEYCKRCQRIYVRQGFTRCSLLPLKDGHFITSDTGISKVLTSKGLCVLHVSSKDIFLPGYTHGFFGGACGIFENKLFVIGNFNNYCDGEKVKLFINSLGYEVVELYDGQLFDGGSIIFIPQ